MDLRFLRNVFFLSLAFVGLCGAVALAGLGRLGAAVATWDSMSGAAQLLLAGAFIAVVWVVAAVVESQIRSITQAYEGYWGGPLKPLRAYGEERHRTRLDELRRAGSVVSIYGAYPLSRKQVMATRLGNILRAAERYPLDRYGADGVLVWPRLYPLLPQAVVTAIGQARGSLDFLLVLSALAVAFAALSGVFLLLVGAPATLFLLCLWGGTAIALLAYRSSLGAAWLYAEVLRATFDLYRLDVLPYVGLPQPDTGTTERQRWQEFYRLVLLNDPLPSPYAPRPKAVADGPA